ncbi:type IV pilus modification protein PilV [Thiorhodococcus minor]|uniref:Type IV pilus modification protein PilV n=1 Tax=Thiorhodococcus minor TaxID=57489 RepID=A0A6M0K739_9GAMM|nr:type IV pilus modification protein PilV [Thiorhodococcus minor]NEV64733.1 type IV pilus modification protein PilV [Thiorhodococcus minor]
MIRKQHGFGLLEVLIAMVVLGVGILGMAHLQASALRLNHSASLRSQASNIAYDILDRMRANRAEAVKTPSPYGAALAATPPSCSPGTLSGATVAARDIEAWRSALACQLPQGTGSITIQDTGSAIEATIITQWDDSRGESSPQQFTVVTSL